MSKEGQSRELTQSPCVRSNEKTAKHKISVWFFFGIQLRINQLPSCPAFSFLYTSSVSPFSALSPDILRLPDALLFPRLSASSAVTPRCFLVSFLSFLVESLFSE